MSWDIRELDREWPFDLVGTDFKLYSKTTALLVIDIQAGLCKVDAEGELARRYPKLVDYYNKRVEEVVIPNTQRLVERFRRGGSKVVFVRNGPITSVGQERTERLGKKGPPVCYRGTSGYEIDSRLAPREDEVVVDKLTAGAFTASYLDHALRNMKIRSLVLAGVVTDMCVFSTARTGAELGYDVVICEDGCAAYSERAHTEALLMHARKFGRVARTDDLIAELNFSDKDAKGEPG